MELRTVSLLPQEYYDSRRSSYPRNGFMSTGISEQRESRRSTQIEKPSASSGEIWITLVCQNYPRNFISLNASLISTPKHKREKEQQGRDPAIRIPLFYSPIPKVSPNVEASSKKRPAGSGSECAPSSRAAGGGAKHLKKDEPPRLLCLRSECPQPCPGAPQYTACIQNSNIRNADSRIQNTTPSS